jgi:hypothetical protein
MLPGEGLFLIPDALIKVARETAASRGETYSSSKEETHQRLFKSTWLISHDQDKKRKQEEEEHSHPQEHWEQRADCSPLETGVS